jgi:hypothetical protein
MEKLCKEKIVLFTESYWGDQIKTILTDNVAGQMQGELYKHFLSRNLNGIEYLEDLGLY